MVPSCFSTLLFLPLCVDWNSVDELTVVSDVDRQGCAYVWVAMWASWWSCSLSDLFFHPRLLEREKQDGPIIHAAAAPGIGRSETK